MTLSNSTAAAEEPQHPTAAIIPFPMPAKAEVPRPEDRLSRALQALNDALAEQQAALTAWRSALGDLKTSTASLDGSLQRYRNNLGSLSTSVSSLQTQARALEQWADNAATTVR